jgi:RNA polymerase sigma factor (sigma-70 family)
VPSNSALPLISEAAPASPTDGVEAIAADLPTLRARFRPFFRRHRLHPHEIDDILQSALVIIVHQRALIRDPLAYFHGTVRRLIGLHLRRRAEAPLVQLAESDEAHLASESPAAEIERRRDALYLLARLPPPARRIALLHYVAGLSHREIGASLGLSEAAVRQQLCRALSRLRAEIQPSPDAPG